MSKQILIHENSLRDGMHPKRHQITVDEMISVATALDRAGMPRIEVTHGDGLGGASINYGFPAHIDGCAARPLPDLGSNYFRTFARRCGAGESLHVLPYRGSVRAAFPEWRFGR